jgi:hypothetical protein
MNIQPNISLILAVYAILLTFGTGFNALIALLERRGFLEGYTAIAVVVGVSITLAGIAVIDPWASLYAIGGFAASGLPMVVGSWWRHVQARRLGQAAMRAEVDEVDNER